MSNNEELQKLKEQIETLKAEKLHLTEFAKQQQQTTKQLQTIIELSHTGAWEWNVQTGETEYNDQWAAMLGYKLDELYPISFQTWVKLTHPDDLTIAQKDLDRYFNNEISFYEAKFRMKHAHGHWIWVLGRGRITQWDSIGKPLIMLGTHQEINRIQEAEQQLEKANRLYAVISQVNQAIVHSKTQQQLFNEICRIAIDYGKFRMAWIGLVNNETKKVEPVSVAGKEDGYLANVYQITLEKNLEALGPVGASIQTNRYFTCNNIADDPEMRHWKDDALKRDYHSVIALPLRLNGHPIAALALYADQANFFNPSEIKLLEEVANDINYALDSIATEAAHAETIKALTESEQRFRLFAESAPVGILIVDQDLNFLFASQQFTSILGYTIDDLPNIGYWWDKAYPEPEYQAFVKVKWMEYLTNLKIAETPKQFEPFEFKVCCKDGTFKNIEFHMAIHAKSHYILLLDRTERRLVQDRLAASEHKFRSLINQMQLGMAVHEMILDDRGYPTDYRFIDCNPAFEELTGLKRSEIIDKTILQILPKTEKVWIENYGKVALTGVPIQFEKYDRELDRYYSVKVYQPAPMQFAVLTEDITEQKTILQKIEDNNQKFRHLSQSATEMLELKNLDSIYEYISRSLHHQYPNTIILFQDVNHAQHTSKLTHIEGVSERIKKMATKLAGYQTIHKEYKLIPEHFEFYLSGKLHLFEKGLADFAGNQFPRFAASTLEKAVGIKQIYTIGIIKDEVLHATIHIFNRGKSPITDHVYIESFVKQAGIVIDRFKTAELLAQSEEKYRLITENTSDVIWVLNVNARKFSYISPAVMQLRGFTSEEAMAQTLEEALTPDSLAHIQQVLEINLERFLKNDLTMEYYMDEIQQPCKDGRIKWIGVSTKFRFNKQGEIEVVGVSRDIDERKKMESSIRDNEQKFRLLFENSPLGIYIANTRGEIEDANQALLKILGSPSLELTKKINVLKYQPLQDNGYAQKFIHCIENRSVITIELPYTTHWGKKVYLSSYLVPMSNAQGEVEKIYTLLEDITQRKQNEEELIKLSLVAKQSPVSIVITNLDGNIEYVNSKFTEVTGYLPEEVLGQNPRILKSGETPQEGYKSMWETLSLGHEWSGIFHNKRKNGELYWEKANIMPVKTTDGNPLYYLALKEDITEQRKAQDALIESELRLKEALAAKDKFFSIISHDLRSPFSTLVSFTELMSDDETNFSVDEYKQYSRALSKTAQSTFSLLENLLEWSRLQRGKIPFKPEQIPMNEFLKTCDIATLEKMKAKKIQFEIDAPDDIMVHADPNMLHAILRNLISNASKFTQSGGRIDLRITANSNNETLFCIHDTGIGMPQFILENLFNISEKISRPGTNNEPSSGLGLILCKEFVEIHGGKIWAESQEGQGSTFYFSLPNN